MEKELRDWYNLHKFYLYNSPYQTKELASFLGVSTRTVQRWLKEKTKPNKEQLVQIKKFLALNSSKEPL